MARPWRSRWFFWHRCVRRVGSGAGGIAGGILSLRLRGDYLAIVTLGFAEIIRIIILNIDRRRRDRFSRRSPAWEGRPIIPLYANFIWIGGFAIITIVVVYNIVRSDIGRVDLDSRRCLPRKHGHQYDALQGAGVCHQFRIQGACRRAVWRFRQFLHTNDFQFIRSIEIIIMIVLGGMGSITGAVLGAIVITILPELLRQLPGNLIHYRLVIYSALLG